MGYTHYFELKEKLNDTVLKDINQVLNKYSNLTSEYDEDTPPIITKESIIFNGHGEDGYETFYLVPFDRGFCKTAEKPYDLPVCEVLLILKHHYRDNFDLSSDGFWVGEVEFENVELDGSWNTALNNIKDEFGYTFKLEGVVSESGSRKYYKFEIF